MQPCTLYASSKTPRQHLFVAASALYLHTGNAAFRAEADFYFDPSTDFLTNWDSVQSIGVAILAASERMADEEAPAHSAQDYRRHFAHNVKHWSECSNAAVPGATWNTCQCAPSRCDLHLVCACRPQEVTHVCVRALGCQRAA